MNDPLYNHVVFGPTKGKGGHIGKSDDQLIQDLIAIHNAENWLGMDGDSELSMFNGKEDGGKGSDRNANSSRSSSNGNALVIDDNKDKSNEVRAEPKGISSEIHFSNKFLEHLVLDFAIKCINFVVVIVEVNGHHHSSFDFDPRNPMASLENNPNVPKNCTITRPPPITRPGG